MIKVSIICPDAPRGFTIGDGVLNPRTAAPSILRRGGLIKRDKPEKFLAVADGHLTASAQKTRWNL
jgi:hypothetical protein